MEDLAGRGYSDDYRGTWIEAAATVFADDLERVFNLMSFDQSPTFSFEGVFSRRSLPESYAVLAEVSLRTGDGHYVLPCANGTEVLKSVDPVSLLYAVVPIESESSGMMLNYRLSRIALPVSGGLEGLVQSLVKNPRGSLLFDPLRAVLSADLGLEPHEAKDFEVNRVLNIDQRTALEHLEVQDQTDLSERPGIPLAVEHSRGAHMIICSRSASGLFDVIEDIVPVHYFPNGAPLRPRVNDLG